MSYATLTTSEINYQTSENLAVGINNLLLRCVRAKTGEKLLLVGEAGKDTYYESDLCLLVKEEALELGIDSRVLYAEPVADAASVSDQIREEMSLSDAVVFFSRLGDQTRFLPSPGNGKKVMCYTLTKAHLRSPFATVDHQRMTQMLQLLEASIRTASNYQIETSDGTNLTGEIIADGSRQTSTAFHVELFPVMIFEPINCFNLTGNLNISKFFTSTSTRAYDDSVLTIETPVNARVESSIITSIDGDPQMVQRIVEQLERAARLSGGNPYVMHSWHTGVNPGTFFEGNPFDNLEYWGTVAYGSPRYTHIHAAGLEPGDVAYHLMDATIKFDGEVFWDNGHFLFLEKPEVSALFTPEERKFLNARYQLDIGM